MLTEPWKRKLIRFAHPEGRNPVPLGTRLDLPKTVLGRKLRLKMTMNPSFHWLNKIQGEVRYDELMQAHTSIRIGGPADVFILPRDARDLQTIFKHRGDTPLFVLGEGTNLLVGDKGLRGLVVSLKNSFKSLSQPDFRTDDEGKEYAVIRAGSGVKLSFLAKYAARFGLTGIEHLVGIPGSLGGALIMNAGAEGTEIGQVVQRVSRVNADGDLETLDAAELQFHYRKTVFPRGEGILVEAELKLYKGDPQAIHRKMDDHLVRRSAKQPLTIPNSGSIFKNPPGDTAGRLIEAAGLKGHRVGQAAVSRKHANFIVNHGEATAQDVRALIRHIQRTVKEQTGTELETEIIWVGE